MRLFQTRNSLDQKVEAASGSSLQRKKLPHSLRLVPYLQRSQCPSRNRLERDREALGQPKTISEVPQEETNSNDRMSRSTESDRTLRSTFSEDEKSAQLSNCLCI